jgi:hypothetical protein
MIMGGKHAAAGLDPTAHIISALDAIDAAKAVIPLGPDQRDAISIKGD